MIGILIVMGGVIALLIGYLILLNYQIKSMAKQLSEKDSNQGYQRLHISLINKSLEDLATHINACIDEGKALKTRQIQSEESLKQAVANISHDLRTPLTTTVGYIQMAKKQDIDKAKRMVYLEIAENRARDLQALLNIFFELSIIERKDYQLSLEPLNISKLLCNALADVYYQFEKQNIETHIEIQDEKLMILGDQVAFKRVIDNLISNMIKYAAGSAEIRLSRQEGQAILVMRNPLGHANINEVNQLFDKFYKGDKARQTDSTGLGLAIVKVLVEKMGGHITCQVEDEDLCMTCKWSAL